jgi:hypothetical protein
MEQPAQVPERDIYPRTFVKIRKKKEKKARFKSNNNKINSLVLSRLRMERDGHGSQSICYGRKGRPHIRIRTPAILH